MGWTKALGHGFNHPVPIKVLLCLCICLAAQTHSVDMPQLISDMPDMQWGVNVLQGPH